MSVFHRGTYLTFLILMLWYTDLHNDGFDAVIMMDTQVVILCCGGMDWVEAQVTGAHIPC